MSKKENGQQGGELVPLLDKLSDAANPQFIQLLIIAGTSGMLGKYFFEKKAADYLDELGHVEVRDSENQVLFSGHLHHQEYLNYKRGFLGDPNTFTFIDAQVSLRDYDILCEIYGIMKELFDTRIDFATECTIMGEAMIGGEAFAEAARTNVSSSIDLLVELRSFRD